MQPIEIEKKWQKRWQKAKIFEAEVEKEKKKYTINTPYPYMNGPLHIGHLYTFMFPEIISRYKRMQGFNVQFSFGFHCTGSPIVSAADRIKNCEEKQIEVLRDLGIEEKDIPKFADPDYWVEYFPKEAKKDLKALGFSIDWRNSFITTSINPAYDKFIQWQFRKLKKKGYIKKGRHAVVWCPKCNSPTGDHARLEGEGETPQQFTILKFKCKLNKSYVYLIAATLRPETVYGQTNLWVNPDIKYLIVRINEKAEETWIMSKECYKKLIYQKDKIEKIGKIGGRDLIHKNCIAPVIETKIPILPSYFCDPNVGTGIVTSVPSDAPYDYMGLVDLQRNKKECEKYGLEHEQIKKIKPIPIIKTDEFGELSAVKICRDLKIESQHDKKLKEATQIIYKEGFYKGVMTENCGKYFGKDVEKARDEIKEEMIRNNVADVMYELSNDVICRCLTKCVVKIVTDQWFIAYSEKNWKKKTHECLKMLKLYPEAVRTQFEYVIDWLNDWACTREFGLGTALPWDKNWVIESLSDSTLQMAYYTIAKYLEHPKGYKIDKINDEFFDYIFLGRGDIKKIAKETEINENMIKKIRQEFEYWYPYDFRNSAKDLVQNHLTFSLFNHTAIFPKKYWPKAYEINGRIMVDGKKMSKSLGNFYTIRELYEKHGADILRFGLANSGEGLDDANFEISSLVSIKKKVSNWYKFVTSNYNKGRDKKENIDDWLICILNKSIKKTIREMEEMRFKSTLQSCFFDLQRYLRWYLRRVDLPNKKVINKFIETQIKMLTPFIPHICEELWKKIGKDGYVSLSPFPKVDESKIDFEILALEKFLKSVLEDIGEILKVTKISPNRILIYTSPLWKKKIFYKAIELAKEKNLEMSKLMKDIMKDNEVRIHAKDASKYAQKILNEIKKMNIEDIQRFGISINEKEYLEESKNFIKKEFGSDVEIYSCDEDIYDPKNKARFAVPFRPAIYIE